jgi:hypothetical protein
VTHTGRRLCRWKALCRWTPLLQEVAALLCRGYGHDSVNSSLHVHTCIQIFRAWCLYLSQQFCFMQAVCPWAAAGWALADSGPKGSRPCQAGLPDVHARIARTGRSGHTRASCPQQARLCRAACIIYRALDASTKLCCHFLTLNLNFVLGYILGFRLESLERLHFRHLEPGLVRPSPWHCLLRGISCTCCFVCCIIQ